MKELCSFKDLISLIGLPSGLKNKAKEKYEKTPNRLSEAIFYFYLIKKVGLGVAH